MRQLVSRFVKSVIVHEDSLLRQTCFLENGHLGMTAPSLAKNHHRLYDPRAAGHLPSPKPERVCMAKSRPVPSSANSGLCHHQNRPYCSEVRKAVP